MNHEIRNKVCDLNNLYKATYICKRNVGWKDSVSGYVRRSLYNCEKLRQSILDGTYDIKPYSIFYVYEPKKRKIVSTRLNDRIFQRSLCDNYLYHELTRHFIYDNGACLQMRGTDFSRKRLRVHMMRFYRKHGLDGYVLKMDLSNFFGSTRHDVAISAIRKCVRDEWAVSEVVRIVNSFNDGDDPEIGLGLGSQVTQLIELAVLDDIDHFIKEQLKIRYYVRYMDDLILIHESKEHLKECKRRISEMLTKIGLSLNKKKTQIFPISKPIKFLGFSHRLTESGKIVKKLLPKKVAHERRKLKRLAERHRKGIMTREDVDRCFISWKAHAQKGDEYFLVCRMETYYKKLMEVT